MGTIREAWDGCQGSFPRRDRRSAHLDAAKSLCGYSQMEDVEWVIDVVSWIYALDLNLQDNMSITPHEDNMSITDVHELGELMCWAARSKTFHVVRDDRGVFVGAAGLAYAFSLPTSLGGLGRGQGPHAFRSLSEYLNTTF